MIYINMLTHIKENSNLKKSKKLTKIVMKISSERLDEFQRNFKKIYTL